VKWRKIIACDVSFRSLLSALLFGVVVCGTEPWTNNDLVQPDQVAKDLNAPLVIQVGFPVLYRSAHITGSVFAGPGSKDEGIADLKKAVAGQPHTREIVLYCGLRAVFVPHRMTWTLEREEIRQANGRLTVVTCFSDLIDLFG
jgi:hypothetical protein